MLPGSIKKNKGVAFADDPPMNSPARSDGSAGSTSSGDAARRSGRAGVTDVDADDDGVDILFEDTDVNDPGDGNGWPSGDSDDSDAQADDSEEDDDDDEDAEDEDDTDSDEEVGDDVHIDKGQQKDKLAEGFWMDTDLEEDVSDTDELPNNPDDETSKFDVVFEKSLETPDETVEELPRGLTTTKIEGPIDGLSEEMHSTLAQLAGMSGGGQRAASTVHTNILLTSLIEYYIKNENPHYTEEEHKMQFGKVLENLSNGNVTYDLTHLAHRKNDKLRNTYLRSFQEFAVKGTAPEGLSTVAVARQQIARAAHADDEFLNASIPSRVGGVHGELLNYICRLGKGGQGTVWRVKHMLDKQEYALKMVKLPAITNGEAIETDARIARILNEMQILAALDHPNVVRYYSCWIGHNSVIPQDIRTPADEKEEYFPADDTVTGMDSRIDTISGEITDSRLETDASDSRFYSGVSDSRQLIAHKGTTVDKPVEPPTHTLYIVMSLAPFALSDHLLKPADSKVDVPQHCFCPLTSLTLFLDLLTGVDYLHKKDLVHRDLKPANIFLHPSTTPPLVNECCGKSPSHFPRIGDFGLATVIDATATNPPVGTTVYRAPEKGKHEKVDVWALGFVAMEIFYKFGTQSERGRVLQAIRDYAEFPKDTDEKLVLLVKGCVNKEPDQRWPLAEVIKYCETWKVELLGGDV